VRPEAMTKPEIALSSLLKPAVAEWRTRHRPETF